MNENILKVFLKLIYEKILNLLFFYFFVSSTYTTVNLNTVYKVSDSTKQKTSEPIKLLFEKGIRAYEKHNYNTAISIWKKVLKVNEKKKDTNLGFKTSINIGAAYNAIGYHKTASQYFISVNSSKKTLKKLICIG